MDIGATKRPYRGAEGGQGAHYPFDMRGVVRGSDGVKRYSGLAPSVAAVLEESVERAPHDEALVELDGPRLSYAQLWERARSVAGGLREAGVDRGDRVAIRMTNGVDWAVTFFGAILAGAVVVPVNTRFTDAEADYVIEDSGAKLVLRDGDRLPSGSPDHLSEIGPDDLAVIFYISNTTGFPKGAMTSHANLLSNIETCLRVAEWDRDRTGQRTLISVPLFHVTGCSSQLLVATAVAGTSVIQRTFEVGRFLRAIEEERIEVLTAVPAIYWYALSQPEFAQIDTSSVTKCTYGGAPISPDLVHRIAEGFPTAKVGNGYGLTESSSVVSFLPHEYAADHADSVGFPAPVVDVRISESDPETGIGELLVRGPNVVSGYWRKPRETAATFVDGWLRTGDLCRVDDNGLLYVVDRLKDVINRGGENVYCVEVENALIAHPDVFEVAVVGVPDEMMGEKVGAVVVPRPGSTVKPEEIRSFALEKLADFKAPQYVAVRNEPLPRNPGGKVLKARLREETDWGRQLR